MKTRTAPHTPTPGSAWRWTLGGALLGCVLAALSWAPARWLAWGVAQASQGQVQWQNPDQLRFVLREGKKRQIRRMCEQVGLKVVGLKRIRMGRVTLGNLPVGQWRYLNAREQF